MQALLRIGLLGAAFGLAVVLALVAAVSASAGPGDLDPTFGVGGRAVFSPGSASQATAGTVQGDGKIVLGGWVGDFTPPPPPTVPARGYGDFTPPQSPTRPASDSGDFLAMRLSADGAPDASFGASGVVRTSINLVPNYPDLAHSVAIGPDGKIVLGGEAGAGMFKFDLALVRYTSNGSLDPSFSGDGIQTLNLGDSDRISGVGVQPDSKVIAVGSGGMGFLVVRLQTDGELDGTFGSGGIVDTPFGDPSSPDAAAAVALQADGRIVVAGTADTVPFGNGDFAVARYLPNGQLDPSFGSGGMVVMSMYQDVYALALTPGGKIVVTGAAGANSMLARFLPNGDLDQSFGIGGVVINRLFGTDSSQARAVAVQPGGKIVMGGTIANGTAQTVRLAIVRYDDDGSLDSAFGDGGARRYDFVDGKSYGQALVVQPGAGLQRVSDRLVEAGIALDSTTHIAAIGVDGGLTRPPPPRCRVPRVVHRRLVVARSRIKRAHCAVGRIRRVRTLRFRGLVVRQSPRAGKRLARGARVNLVVGRR